MRKGSATGLLPAILLIVLAMAVAADEGSPEESSIDAGAVERIAVWYATIRNKTAQRSAGEIYGGMRGELRTGVCAMDFSPIPGLSDVADAAPFYIPDERKELQHVEEFSHDRFWKAFDTFSADASARILFYVHGYNVDFEKSCRRAAIFQRSLPPHHRLLLFSWPADGNPLAYTRDEADLVWSVSQITEMLNELAMRIGTERVDVVGHSLGARGVVMALLEMACRRPPEPLVNELVLVAPDIDTGHFRHLWPQLRRLAKRVTLYVSANDKALGASHQAHGYPRLGEAGEYLTVLPGIETIDVSPAGRRRYSGHIYHLYHPKVATDLKELLAGGRSADQRSGLRPAELNGAVYWRLTPAAP